MTSKEIFEVIATEVTPIVVDGSSSSSQQQSHPEQQQGRWNSRLLSCCKYGCFHQALLCAWCFPTLLMGQLLTRMKMNWLGDPTVPPSEEYKKTFKTVVTIWAVYMVLYSFFDCAPEIPTEIGDTPQIVMIPNPDCPPWKYNVANGAASVFGLYTIVVMIRLRVAIRSKYNIPQDVCIGCEDCCCVLFCGCCSAVQMAHQTADYDTENAVCCNATGLPPAVETTATSTTGLLPPPAGEGVAAAVTPIIDKGATPPPLTQAVVV